MVARPLAVLIALPVVLSLGGCIFVSSSREYGTPKKVLEQTREVVPGDGAPTFRGEYREQLAHLAPGMSVEQLRSLFPQAVFIEQYEDENRTVDVYSVKMSVAYHYREGVAIHTADEEAKFYFHEGKLLKWRE